MPSKKTLTQNSLFLRHLHLSDNFAIALCRSALSAPEQIPDAQIHYNEYFTLSIPSIF